MFPVLDWRASLRARDATDFQGISARLAGSGFLLPSCHGIRRFLIDASLAAATRLFRRPEWSKSPFHIRTSSNNRGCTARGSAKPGDSKPGLIDRNEAFNIGIELADDDLRMDRPFRTPNLWPDLPGFRDPALACVDAVLRLEIDLHRATVLDLRLRENHFTPLPDDLPATPRLLHCPRGVRDGRHRGGRGLRLHRAMKRSTPQLLNVFQAAGSIRNRSATGLGQSESTGWGRASLPFLRPVAGIRTRPLAGPFIRRGIGPARQSTREPGMHAVRRARHHERLGGVRHRTPGRASTGPPVRRAAITRRRRPNPSNC